MFDKLLAPIYDVAMLGLSPSVVATASTLLIIGWSMVILIYNNNMLFTNYIVEFLQSNSAEGAPFSDSGQLSHQTLIDY